MNFVDLFIIAVLLFSLVRGSQLGLLYVFFSIGATLLGLLIGSTVGQFVAHYATTELSRMLIIIGFAAAGGIILSEIGVRIARALTEKSADLKLDTANSIGGAILETVFILIVFWLVSPAVINIQSAGLGREVRESSIIGRLQSGLGQPPDIFSQIASTISPNGFPNVFALEEPVLKSPNAPTSLDPAVVEKARKSVVKIEGRGCGGIVDGSGWVVSGDLVVTNAHVISGIASPTIVEAGRTYAATPIYFNPDLDIAVLNAKGLNLPALPLHEPLLKDGSSGAIIGFPGGGKEIASASVVIDHVVAVGRNIYNRGRIQRQIYEIAADVQQGDSGGPLIDENGAVAGIIFAKSVSQANIGYAITMPQALPSIRAAESSRTAVSTGRCSAE